MQRCSHDSPVAVEESPLVVVEGLLDGGVGNEVCEIISGGSKRNTRSCAGRGGKLNFDTGRVLEDNAFLVGDSAGELSAASAAAAPSGFVSSSSVALVLSDHSPLVLASGSSDPCHESVGEGWDICGIFFQCTLLLCGAF